MKKTKVLRGHRPLDLDNISFMFSFGYDNERKALTVGNFSYLQENSPLRRAFFSVM